MSAGRKSPVVLLRWKRPTDARQAIWDEIRSRGSFSVTDLSQALKIERRTVASYVEALMAGRFLSSSLGASGIEHGLLKDVGIHAPRLRRDGTPVEQGRGRAGAWRGMRVLKRFTIRELHIATGAAESDIKSFCTYLVKAGYLKFVVKGAGSKPSTFALVRDTGPKPPQVTRIKCVFDPNLNAVTWPTAEIEAEIRVEGQP